MKERVLFIVSAVLMEAVFCWYLIIVAKAPHPRDYPDSPMNETSVRSRNMTESFMLKETLNGDVHKLRNDTFTLAKEDIKKPGWIWDSSPIVTEYHKLIFFTIPKVGCTVFKQLFRRMKGYEDWRTRDPHDPSKNGLRYLVDYSLEDAAVMITSPEWTKAVFVRDPKSRFLSAYLDKVQSKDGVYIKHHCPKWPVPQNMTDFLALSKKCYDPHWAPQTKRVRDEIWDRMDFVGAFEYAQDDVRVLLERIGAWDQYGTGWGPNETESIFGKTKTKHATGSKSRFAELFTESLEREVEQRYGLDYGNEKIARALRPVPSS